MSFAPHAWRLLVAFGPFIVFACGSEDHADPVKDASAGSGGSAGTPGGSGGAGGYGGSSTGGTPSNGGTSPSGGSTAIDGAAGAGGAAAAAGAGGVGGTSAPCGDIPIYAPVLCLNCLESKCCAEMKACSDNAECVALRTCGGQPGCQSGACWQQCQKDHASGVPDQEVFGACLTYKCAAECGDPADCGFTFGSATCGTCANAQCCQEIWAAASSVEYWKWEQCWFYCPTTECRDQCAVDHAAGFALSQTYVNCLTAKCQTECGL